MTRHLPWIGRRLLLGAAQTAAVVLLVLLLTEALPGDAAVALAGDQPDPERIARIRTALGLDRPAAERLLDRAAALLHGDLGTSLAAGRPVTGLLAAALAPTALLAAATLTVLVPLSVALGVASARREGGRLDRTLSSLTLAVHSVPEFALGVLLVTAAGLLPGLLPPTAVGVDPLAEPAVLVLPVLVLAARPVCTLSRLIRAGMIDALASPYADQALRYGIGAARVRWTHALPGALAPAAQQLARTCDWLLGGVVVVEALFALPGLGTLTVDAVAARDLPVLQGAALVFAAVAVLVNLGADLAVRRLAPRKEAAA
ncbi:ABC transporter permease [Streptomyces griseus]|uniref:ABC transporter permease n=1 Tax=Streptomyces griseus TaxID=1911 RepID=UPI0004C5B541